MNAVTRKVRHRGATCPHCSVERAQGESEGDFWDRQKEAKKDCPVHGPCRRPECPLSERQVILGRWLVTHARYYRLLRGRIVYVPKVRRSRTLDEPERIPEDLPALHDHSALPILLDLLEATDPDFDLQHEQDGWICVAGGTCMGTGASSSEAVADCLLQAWGPN